MGAVARIVELLQWYPDLELRVDYKTVTVEPRNADGFPVSLTEGRASGSLGSAAGMGTSRPRTRRWTTSRSG